MLCQNCRENVANIKYTQIINGVKKELILCEECAEKLGINKLKMKMPINFLGDFFGDYSDEQLLSSFMKEMHNQCDNCGELYDDCTKKPLNIEEKMNNIGENNINADKHSKFENINKLENLQFELEKAIKEERYEDAAVIRDKIKKIA